MLSPEQLPRGDAPGFRSPFYGVKSRRLSQWSSAPLGRQFHSLRLQGMELATRIERAQTPSQGAGPPLGVTSISSGPPIRTEISTVNSGVHDRCASPKCFTGDRRALLRRHAVSDFQRAARAIAPCGSGSWNRTNIHGFRDRRPTVRRSRSAPAVNRTPSDGLRTRCSTNELQARERLRESGGI